MAYRVFLHDGSAVWRPDRITVGRFKLDPRLTPMENLWTLCRIQTSIWLSAFGVYSRTSPEDMDDLFYTTLLTVFLTFRRKVWAGKYNRNFTLYQNVRSAAWSVVGHEVKIWKTEMEKNIDVLHWDHQVGMADRVITTLGDITSYEQTKKYVSLTEYKEMSAERKRKERLAASTNSNQSKAVREYFKTVRDGRSRINNYLLYCEYCEEFGISPISEEEFIKNNYGT